MKSRDQSGRIKLRYIIAFAILGLGVVIGIIAAYSPIASYSRVSSGLITPFAVDPNDYKTEPLQMVKSEVVDFSVQLDNKTVFRFYIMNSTQLQVFEKCAPRCMQPLLGGSGFYYQQAGLTRPDLYLNVTISDTAPFSDRFIAPNTGYYYFVFDNSEGQNFSTYLGQNATGFTAGTLTISTSQTSSTYAVNWHLATIAVVEIILGGVVATIIWEPKVRKLKPAKLDRFARRFGLIVAVVAILAILIFDAPIFYSAFTSSIITLPGSSSASSAMSSTSSTPGSTTGSTTFTGTGSIGGTITSTSSATSTGTTSSVTNYSIFLIDADYLDNVGPSGFGSLAIDNNDQFLYAAAKQNNSIYIYDLPDEAEQDVYGFSNPQSVLYISQSLYQGILYVTNAGNGTVDILSDNSTGGIFGLVFQRLAEIKLPSPGQLAYDSSTDEVYIGYGNGSNSGIAVIDANTSSELGTIPLKGAPAQIVAEQVGSRIFANIPSLDELAVIDKNTQSAIAYWNVTGTGNIPIALDESNDRLFVGTTNPPQIVVLDDNTGSIIKTLPISGAPGDLTFDPASGLISASDLDGNLSSYQEYSPFSYGYVGDQSTSVGAIGSIFFSAQEEVLVVGPPYGGQGSQVFTFAIYAD